MNGAVLANPSTGPSANGLFGDLPPRPRGLLRPRWWLLALALHLALLVLPWDVRPPERDSGPAISVEVRFERGLPPATAEIPATETQATERPEPLNPARPDRSGETPVRQPAADAATPTDAGTPEATGPGAGEPEAAVNAAAPVLRAAQLLESVASMDWTVPEPTSTIGRPVTSETAKAWVRPLLPRQANALDGTFAPEAVEIVDRWQGPGGVHQVVIRAPNGETYCGRQAPMDDFRPWTQIPMLFHRCAGGGGRSDEASWRNN